MITTSTTHRGGEHGEAPARRGALLAAGWLCAAAREHRWLVYVSLAAVLSGACATTRAAAPIERPTLEVPPPPPRVILPLPPPPQTPMPEPVADLPPNPNGSAPSRPRPQRDRTEATKPADPKPEAVTPPVEPAPAPPPPAPVAPAPQLRTPETANPGQLGGLIRDLITNARGILEKTDYGPLSNARKKAYDDAKLFAQQADEALKTDNLTYAKELAEKAQQLAKTLQNR